MQFFLQIQKYACSTEKLSKPVSEDKAEILSEMNHINMTVQKQQYPVNF